MKVNRSTYLNTRRDAWIEVNLDSVEYNVKKIKSYIPKGSKLLAVVKADAYGLGSVMIAPTLLASGVDYLGVASIDEGVQLREANIFAPILVLGAVPVWSINSAVVNNIAISIFSDEHIEACRIAHEKNGIKPLVHIKVDTGMNRIGVGVDYAVEFIKKAQKSNFINLEGIFTHFACAENKEITKLQLDKWDKILDKTDTAGLLIHTDNTAAILSYSNVNSNMSRAGIAIYGLLPDLSEESQITGGFKEVLSLKGRITNIHTANKGEGVSYSHSFKAQSPAKIATVPIGYADGIARALSNRIFGSLNGKKIKQAGNITMDQIMFDITGVKAEEGDIITLLGEDEGNFLSVNTWAELLGTINYELICRLRVRLSRVYTRD